LAPARGAKVVYQRFHQQHIDVPMPTVKQQHMKSRWGSCTPLKQLIKMNMRLLEGPQAYIEYVMVHEFVGSFQELSQFSGPIFTRLESP